MHPSGNNLVNRERRPADRIRHSDNPFGTNFHAAPPHPCQNASEGREQEGDDQQHARRTRGDTNGGNAENRAEGDGQVVEGDTDRLSPRHRPDHTLPVLRLHDGILTRCFRSGNARSTSCPGSAPTGGVGAAPIYEVNVMTRRTMPITNWIVPMIVSGRWSRP